MGKIPRIRTGIGALDVVLGGGVPLGGSTLIWGPPKAGKTTVVGNIIASFQRQSDQDIIYVETEDKYDSEYFQSIGVMFNDHFIKKEGVYYLSEVLDFGLEILRGIEEYENVGMVIIDSVGGLHAEMRVEKSVDDRMIPPESLIISQTMGQYITEQKRRRYLKKPVTTIFTTHQLMRNSTNPRLPPSAVPAGGNRFQFLTGTRIRLRKVEYQNETTVQGIKRPIRGEIPFQVNANLGGPSGDSGSFRFFQVASLPFLPGQPDELDFWWNFGAKTGYIGGGGQAWTVGNRPDVYKGKIPVLDFWRENMVAYREDQENILPLAIQYLREATESRGKE